MQRDPLANFAQGLAALETVLAGGDRAWAGWQDIGWRWAQLTNGYHDPELDHPPAARDQFIRLRETLDAAFYGWLTATYGRWAGSALPEPHHLYHVPGWLAYQRRQQPALRLTLLVLDGMGLGDWLQIRAVWQSRHPAWHLTEQLVLAQIPSITAVSRQALISGQPPRQFADSLDTNAREEQQWQAFWMSDPGLSRESAAYSRLPTRADAYPDAIDSRRTQAICLVSPAIDEMVHGATQGAADVQASLGIWLGREVAHGSGWMEGLIQHLLDSRYRVILTSDHGHIEAVGMGQPREGVLAGSRTKRTRYYRTAEIAARYQAQFPDTVLWQGDGLLPDDVWYLLPQGRRAFAPVGERVVTHGGLTIDELLVPLVTIQPG